MTRVSPGALDSAVTRIERIPTRAVRQGQSRTALLREIEDFFVKYAPASTPLSYLQEAEQALAVCNLPLTNRIFRQEKKMMKARFPDHGLVISPTVTVSVVAEKPQRFSTVTQCNRVDFERIARMKKKMLTSMTSLRDDISAIANEYARHRERKAQRSAHVAKMCDVGSDGSEEYGV